MLQSQSQNCSSRCRTVKPKLEEEKSTTTMEKTEDDVTLTLTHNNANDKALRAILDSKLNKAGMVGAVYVKTDQGVLFEIKPHVRIPRTCKRFCGVILELLGHKCIRDKDTNEILMRVVEEPVTRHLPVNSRVVGLSYSSEKLVDIDEYVNSGSDELNLVFVVGAMVHGKISKEYTDDFISVSNYPLSAQYCIGLICESLEHKWKIF
ncbi:ribosomal RNA small subunit methyltransferase nep-1-like [Prunus yedoensis var. nudiflora]|uniref:Ribosomal RNA small subunit methyltransferase nep-1-like n=1 Tax=Prunus yedoensis var. nudiflora TaxID=2094558 RepID=A0A314Z2V3_PRUYE|nr:ribosomal RNA small subunit methyltransferase nep-1-like [Prunus yedoensis var. nudiflora]